MIDKKSMQDAAPHIERAARCLDMLKYFVVNKHKLSLDKRVPVYYNQLIESVLALQGILLTDTEYTERVARSIAKVSETREYSYNVVQNNKGETFYDIDA